MRSLFFFLALTSLAVGVAVFYAQTGRHEGDRSELERRVEDGAETSFNAIPSAPISTFGGAERPEPAGREAAPDEGESDDAPIPETGTVEILVRSHEHGAPIRDAPVWIFVQGIIESRTDASGRARFDVPPGRYQIGAEAPHGSNYFAQPYHLDSKEPAAESYAEATSGSTTRAELVLYRGASITGRVLDSNGDAVPNFQFLFSSALENKWVKPQERSTDATGAFELNGLEGGWYLIGSMPWRVDFFEPVRVELAFGDHHHLDIQLAARRTVEIVVQPVVDGEPIEDARPARIYFRRDDGMGRLGWSTKTSYTPEQSFESARLPHSWSAQLCDGLNRVTVAPVMWNWMAGSNRTTREIEITNSTRRVVIEIEHDAPPDYATILGRMSSPVDRSNTVFAREPGKGKRGVRTPLRFDRTGSEFELHIDRAYMPADSIEFIYQSTVFGTAPLLERSQSVSLTLPGE